MLLHIYFCDDWFWPKLKRISNAFENLICIILEIKRKGKFLYLLLFLGFWPSRPAPFPSCAGPRFPSLVGRPSRGRLPLSVSLTRGARRYSVTLYLPPLESDAQCAKSRGLASDFSVVRRDFHAKLLYKNPCTSRRPHFPASCPRSNPSARSRRFRSRREEIRAAAQSLLRRFSVARNSLPSSTKR